MFKGNILNKKMHIESTLCIGEKGKVLYLGRKFTWVDILKYTIQALGWHRVRPCMGEGVEHRSISTRTGSQLLLDMNCYNR